VQTLKVLVLSAATGYVYRIKTRKHPDQLRKEAKEKVRVLDHLR
jgi:hypothetical protein